MEGGGENMTPFWLQSTTNVRRVDRYRHRLSSLFFNVGILLVFLLVTAVFFIVFVLPTTRSYSSAQIFRPNAVKKSWDSVNLVLVIFALLFGFLSRNRNNDDSTSDHQYHRSNSTNVAQKSNPSTPKNEWYDSYNSDQTLLFNNSTRSSTTTTGGLMRRNSTSYPDLQLHDHSTSTWITGEDRWQFYDDHRVYYRRRSWKEADNQIIEPYKNIHVDTFVSKVPEQESTHVSPPPSPPPLPSSPPPPPPPPPQRQRHRAANKEKERIIRANDVTRGGQTVGTDHLEPRESFIPPAPPPPPRRTQQQREQKSSRSDNKKRDGANASKDNFLTSFYQKKKKKRQRQRSVDNLDALFHHSQPPAHSHSQPQLQQQPPPSVFQHLFSSRKGKKRRIPSDPNDLDPPTPFVATKALLKSTAQAQAAATYKPPLPVKISSFKSVDDNSSSGGSSPLVAIPPPPPPPPFKMRDWKFVVQGDYVRIESDRSQSPDVDEGDMSSSTSTPSAEAASSFFCPSPDVDAKADNFIARFKAELKLQKINSFNQKQAPTLSNLGRPCLASTHI